MGKFQGTDESSCYFLNFFKAELQKMAIECVAARSAASFFQKISRRWLHSIEFSQPRGSIEAPDALMVDIFPEFVKEF